MIFSHFVSDDSSSEEETTVDLAKQRRLLRSVFDPLQLSNQVFKKNFRVSKEIFLDILAEIEPKFPPVKGKELKPNEILAAALRFLAEGSYQNGTGNDYKIAISQPTFSVAFAKCLNIIEETLGNKWISLAMEPNEQQDARRYFFSKSGIPGVVMCVDGTHIKIIAPVDDYDQHYNRKGYYSLNAMITSHTEWHRSYTSVSRSEMILTAAKTIATLYKHAVLDYELTVASQVDSAVGAATGPSTTGGDGGDGTPQPTE